MFRVVYYDKMRGFWELRSSEIETVHVLPKLGEIIQLENQVYQVAHIDQDFDIYDVYVEEVK